MARDYRSTADAQAAEARNKQGDQMAELLKALIGGNAHQAALQTQGEESRKGKQQDLDIAKSTIQNATGAASPEEGMKKAYDSGASLKIGDTTIGQDPYARAAAMQQGLQSRNANQAQNAVNRDRTLQTYVQRIDGAQKIKNLMDAAEKGDFKSNQAMLGQLNAEIGRLETGAQNPGLGQSEKTEMLDTAAKYHNMLDTLTGNVTGVDLSQKFGQARGMVNDLGRSYYDAINHRMGSLKAGAMPDQQPVYDAKQDFFKNTYGGFDPAQAKPEMVSQNQPHQQPQQSPGLLDSFKNSISRFIGGNQTTPSPAAPPTNNLSQFVPNAQPAASTRRVRQKSTGQMFDVDAGGNMTPVKDGTQ